MHSGKEEKDGNDMYFYIGVFVFNVHDENSYFNLFDERKLVTRLKLPHRVPYGFHALWVTGKQLEDHIDYHKSSL